jgi:hypothetical protein
MTDQPPTHKFWLFAKAFLVVVERISVLAIYR